MKLIKIRTQKICRIRITNSFLILFCLFAGIVYAGSKEEIGKNNPLDVAQKLAGHWVRPDGGYKLVIENIQPDGSLKASYFNPTNINVHEANWKVNENGVHLFVELRDKNYPGSTYSLTHIKEKDLLIGTYFQATQKQNFQVYFIRFKETLK